MWTKLFKKESAFSYKRLFFVLVSFVLVAGIGFSIYVLESQKIVQVHKKESENFFNEHQTQVLTYKQKRNVYIEKFGMPTKTDVDKEQRQVIDTYTSKDVSRGITVISRLQDDSMENAYIIGYLITGKEVVYDENIFDDIVGRNLTDVVNQLGNGEVFSESKTDETFSISFRTKKDIYILKGDKNTGIIQEIQKKSLFE